MNGMGSCWQARVLMSIMGSTLTRGEAGVCLVVSTCVCAFSSVQPATGYRERACKGKGMKQGATRCGEIASLSPGAYVGVCGGAGPRSERPWICVDGCIGVRPGGAWGSGWYQAGAGLTIWWALLKARGSCTRELTVSLRGCPAIAR